jgi:hypothetical protein
VKLIAFAVLVLGSCATTVEDRPLADANPTPISGGVIVDDSIPATTIPIEGTATELLPEMATEMSRLGGLIVDGGDAEGSLARIQQIWETIRPEIEQTRPGLVNGIAATVELAVTAVERTRPADADKAFSLLTDLVDAFTGDG